MDGAQGGTSLESPGNQGLERERDFLRHCTLLPMIRPLLHPTAFLENPGARPERRAYPDGAQGLPWGVQIISDHEEAGSEWVKFPPSPGTHLGICVSDHQKLEREARICRLLKHPNIGELWGTSGGCG